MISQGVGHVTQGEPIRVLEIGGERIALEAETLEDTSQMRATESASRVRKQAGTQVFSSAASVILMCPAWAVLRIRSY